MSRGPAVRVVWIVVAREIRYGTPSIVVAVHADRIQERFAFDEAVSESFAVKSVTRNLL